jgi:hypothetical protein
MALEKILYPLVIDGGIDTKTDSALLPVGKNLISDNTDFQEYGSINKRAGLISLPSVSNSKSIISHNDQLLSIGQNGTDLVYSYDEKSASWIAKDSDVLSPMIFIDEEHNGEFELQCIDSFENVTAGFRFTACIYRNSNGFLASHTTRLVVYKTDYLTGNKKVILDEITISSLGVTNEWVKINGLPGSSTNIWLTIHTSEPKIVTRIYNQSGTSIASSTNSVNPTFWFDTVTDSTTVYYVGQTTAGANKLRCKNAGQTGLGNTATITLTGQIDGTIQSGLAIALKGDNLYIAYCDNVANRVRIKVVDKEFFGDVIADTIVANIGVAINKISIISTGSGASDPLLMVVNGLRSTSPLTTSTSFGTYNDSYLFVYTIHPTTLVSTNLKSNYESGSLASKIFTVSGISGFFIITQSLTVDYFKYNLYKIDTTKASDRSNLHAGSFAVLTALGDSLSTLQPYLLKNYLLAQPETGKDSKIYVPLAVTERSIPLRQTDDDTIVFSGFKIGKTFRIDFDSEYSNINSRLGENTAVTGATIKNFDSFRFMNGVFLDAPEIQRLEEVNGTNAAGTYSYKGIYEFTDNNGQLWRSTESIPRTITIVGGKGVRVTWNLFHPTDLKNYLASNYSITYHPDISSIKYVLYRTTNGGTTYYRLGSVTAGQSSLVNGLFLNPWTDNLVDLLLVGNESLYTNGGVLSNDTLPPIKYLVSSQNRMFALSSEDENLIYYSQPYLAGECVNWSLALSIRVDSGSLNKSGKVIALASMDGKVICFKNNSIIAFAGDGPNQLGEDNNFTTPQTISTTIGCIEPKSVETIPGGVIFKSPSGIYLLDRSLNLQYIGSDVEDYNSETIVGVANLSTKNSVCFLTANRTLVYEYIQGKWSTWNIGGESCCIWKNRFTVLNAGTIKYQDTSVYKDGSTFYSMTLSTPWIKIAGVQEYQRIYKLILFGQFKSAHTLTARIYFDYNETDYEDHVISPLITDPIYQYEVSLTNQKCQSFKIKINDNVDSGSGQGFKLTNITLQLGKKKGFNKLPSTRKY